MIFGMASCYWDMMGVRGSGLESGAFQPGRSKTTRASQSAALLSRSHGEVAGELLTCGSFVDGKIALLGSVG